MVEINDELVGPVVPYTGQNGIMLGGLNEDRFILTAKGLQVEGEPTMEVFGQALGRANGLGNATMWVLGDLLVYAESRSSWGEKYTQFLDLTQRSYTSLSRMHRVSKAFAPEDREFADKISWSHHFEVLKVEAEHRNQWLKEAYEHDWNREELREMLRTPTPDDVKTVELPESASLPDLVAATKVKHCPHCGAEIDVDAIPEAPPAES